MSSVAGPGRTWNFYAHAIRGTYQHIGSKQWVELHGSPHLVVSVIAEEWIGDARDPTVTHYGWESWSNPGNVTMIYPRSSGREDLVPWLLLEMCFPAGMQAEIQGCEGRMIALRIEQRDA